MIKMSVTGAKEIAIKLARPLTNTIERFVSTGAAVLQTSIVNAAPKKSGKYAQTIKVKHSGLFTYTVSDQFPGPLLRSGAKAHIILPRRAQALWWPGMIGRPVTVVHHPGFKPMTYVQDGINRAKPQLNVVTRQFEVEIVKELTK
jgi:hypothetical protein